MRIALAIMLAITASSPAFAEPEDEETSEQDVDADETEEERKKREEAEKSRLDEGDDLDLLDDEDALDAIEMDDEDEDEEGSDLLDGVKEDEIRQEGQDTSRIYSEAEEDFADLQADEEMLAWDRYLEKYPNSLYRDRIERRLEDLELELYQERKSTKEEDRLDADERDVPISAALLLQNINPGNRAMAGFEWGLPSYINLMLDAEFGITREFSVHAGLRNRFLTWNLEAGARYAFVKSSRTQTLVTGILDFRLATSPAYIAARPQIGFGQRVKNVDIQAQIGIDQELRGGSTPRIIGGANVTGRIDETVSIFVETNYNAKGFGKDGVEGLYTFPTASFGFKLYPGVVEVNIGASVPYATRYYRWHDGSIMGQVNHYF